MGRTTSALGDALTLKCADEIATLALAGALAPALVGVELVALQGDLGAGKTTFVRGLLRALGVSGPVRSPTFTLLEPYEVGGLSLRHLDLYRIAHAGELEMLGLRDEIGRAVLLVEWPSRGEGWLPPADLVIHLQLVFGAPNARELALVAHTEHGRRLQTAMMSRHAALEVSGRC